MIIVFRENSLTRSTPPIATRTPSHLDAGLQGEHQKPGESGVLPAAPQVPPLQFEGSLVPPLHRHQPRIGGGLSGDVLVAGEGGNHRPAVENQTGL